MKAPVDASARLVEQKKQQQQQQQDIWSPLVSTCGGRVSMCVPDGGGAEWLLPTASSTGNDREGGGRVTWQHGLCANSNSNLGVLLWFCCGFLSVATPLFIGVLCGLRVGCVACLQ